MLPLSRGPMLLGLLGLAWPLLALLLVPLIGPWPLLVAAVALACWRLPAGRKHWSVLLGLAALLTTQLGHAELGVRAWPVIVNATLLSVFAWSLRQPQSMIERLARRQEPDLPARRGLHQAGHPGLVRLLPVQWRRGPLDRTVCRPGHLVLV
ncbi:COG4648 family protein [Modicisalibacter luteus]|uniref:hypothetical protein n=1 Tax=Modicisalibacter luteus TaxID=453962 RepID=UPI00362EFA40